jgi:hypothetical protein
MNESIRAVDCPSCGAPIKIPEGGQRFFTCRFCGTTLEDQTTPKERETGQYPKVVIHTVRTTTPYKVTVAPTVSQPSKRAGWIVLFLIIALVAIGVIVPLFFTGVLTLGGVQLADQLASLRVYSFGPSRLLPSDTDSQPDIVAISRNSDDTRRMVYVDFDADSNLRWQSDPLGNGADYTFNPIIADRSFVLLAYETTLVAFNRADGTIAWQVDLSDEITNICDRCLQFFDDSVVTLTTDGMLSGFNIQTGDSTWSVRLNETPRQLMNLAGKAGVLDKENDDVGINIYDPVTGGLVQRIVPECPNEVFPDYPQTLGIYDPVLVSSDGINFFVPISDRDPGCIQKWDAVNLTQVWQVAVPRDILSSMTWDSYLFTDPALYISDGHNLFVVSMMDGSYKDVFSDEDHDLVPLAVQDSILVTLAKRTRGTSQYSILGIDMITRSMRWEFIPAAEDFYENGSDVVYQEGLWSAGVVYDQVAILEAFSDPSFMNFTILNLADGSQIGLNSIDLREDSFNYWIQVLGWKDSQVYLVGDNLIRLIDFTTATEVAVWP